jgi:hypothetical protein
MVPCRAVSAERHAKGGNGLPETPSNEPRGQRIVLHHGRPWWAIAPVVASLALALFALLLWRENRQLREENSSALQKADSYRDRMVQGRELSRHTDEEDRELAAFLTSPESQQVSLKRTKGAPQPSAWVMYVRAKGHLLMLASSMPRLPHSKIYELWLIPIGNSTPMAAGSFTPDQNNDAIMMNPPITPGTTAKAFAVSVEAAPKSQKPTTAFLLMGSVPPEDAP